MWLLDKIKYYCTPYVHRNARVWAEECIEAIHINPPLSVISFAPMRKYRL